MHQRVITIAGLCFVCVALTDASSRTHAQNALGSGNALGDGNALGAGNGLNTRKNGNARSDGSVGIGTSGYGDALDSSLYIGANGVRDLRNIQGFRPDFKIGNLMVTRSVAGDKNFRGDVGYTASSDFRGWVGGDSIFNELQGSALSQIQYVNSPLANDRYATALGMGLYEYRRDYTPAEQIYTVSQAAELNQDRIRLDRTNAYTASSDLYDTAVNAASLRLIRENSEDGQLLSVEATPLQGVYSRVIGDGSIYSGLSFYDRAALASEIRSGDSEADELGMPFETPTASIAPEAMIDSSIRGDLQIGDQFDGRIEGNILAEDPNAQMNAYERVVRELVMRYGDDESVHLDVNPEVLERVRQELDELRELTMGLELSPAARNQMLEIKPTRPGRTDGDDQGAGATLGTDDSEPILRSSETEEEKEERIRAERSERLSRAAELLRNGGQIGSFSEGQTGRIQQLMAEGERRLKFGEFFDAEARFDQVLRINPGNPLALYGRANAQVGAGLYLSAALSLRKLYSSYPELIGTDLAPEFLPSETRLRLAVAKLHERIERGNDLPSYGLCLAYVGRLIEEPELISEGLAQMDLSEGDQALAALLRQVWLHDEPGEREPPAPTE